MVGDEEAKLSFCRCSTSSTLSLDSPISDPLNHKLMGKLLATHTFYHRRNQLICLSTFTPPNLTTEPPKKKLKSRWDDDDEEEITREKERKKAKKAALAARLAKEKLELQTGGTTPSAGSSNTSREGTPGSRTPGRDQDRTRPPAARRIPKRGREAHPLIESCRSVYSYEVSSSFV